jgi:hypothetical protein
VKGLPTVNKNNKNNKTIKLNEVTTMKPFWLIHFLIKVALNVPELELFIKVLLSVAALEFFISRPLFLDVESNVVSVETVVDPGVFGRSPTFRIPKKSCKKQFENRWTVFKHK